MAKPDNHAKAVAAASEAHRRHGAERAIDDPVKLDRAARIIRLALEHNRITLADLQPTAKAGT